MTPLLLAVPMLLVADVTALPAEVHGVWSAWGMQAGKWDEIASDLSESSINLLMPNMLYGCVAAFDTDLLPASQLFSEHGDVMAECLDACRSRGIQVHVWVVLWKLGRNTDSFVDSMQAAGRTQVSATGEPSDWLCPTDPVNRQLMLDLIRELVTRFDPHGVQLDYIRYPNTRHCFCDGCRERFSEDTGLSIRCWPGQVLEDGRYHSQYVDWRTSTITGFVEDVRSLLDEEAPDVMLSAAVLPDLEDALGNGQDWSSWAEEGLVDFLVPMDYTDSLELFRSNLAAQMAAVQGLPLVAGIGAFATGLDLTPDEISAQIHAASEAGTTGWALYHLNWQLLLQKLPELDIPE